MSRLADLLNPDRKPDTTQLRRWMDIGEEIAVFGDSLPMEWQRCAVPQHMVWVLANTSLVRVAEIKLRNLMPAIRSGSGPTLQRKERVNVLRIESLDRKVLETAMDEEHRARTCDLIRGVVPVVKFSDLTPRTVG